MNKIDKKKTTFISGLWIIDNNPKNSYRHYMEYMPQTLNMIQGSRLLFFHDNQDIFQQVERHCSKNNIELKGVYRSIDNLPTEQYRVTLVNCCEKMKLNQFEEPLDKGKEKGTEHYWREFIRGGPETYGRLVTIWTSKIPLVWESVQRDTFCNTDDVAWIDISIARIRHKRQNWKFMKQKYPPGLISHYGSPMTYYGVKLPLSAGFLFGRTDAWQLLIDLYEKNIKKISEIPYAHDDETILHYCVSENPSLFHTIGKGQAGSRLTRKLRKRITGHK